jgi:hypothetical protein
VGVFADVLGPNMLSTTSRRTEQSVSLRILEQLLIPLLLEFYVEEAFDVLDRYVLLAAGWGHMLRISGRQLERLLQAGIAHTMAALELDSFGVRQVLTTNKAFSSETAVSTKVWMIYVKKIAGLAHCLTVLVFSGTRPGRSKILSTIEGRPGGVVTLGW